MQSFYKKKHVTTYEERKIKKAYCDAHRICEACRKEPTINAHHIVTEGSGGPTEEWNLLALCAFCHNPIFHGKGWKFSCQKFPHLAGKIVAARIRMGRKT